MPPASGLFRRVVHASDFSRASGKAFATAVALARAHRAALTVVHVLTPVVPVAGEGYVLPETYEQIDRSARAAAQKQLDRLVAKATAARLRAEGLLRTGVPLEEIVRVARAVEAAGADLLNTGIGWH
ncbi:MAG TPA: universal stress protein, partial [Methylomirabilota bacterium]|nr:universal stress protein [Methylomirabilota bacterium]